MSSSDCGCESTSCCGGSSSVVKKDAESIRAAVRERYASAAVEGRGCGCGSKSISERAGYDAADLATLPDGANLGLSCGNPTAIAALEPGEVVLDLGAGGGLDIFLAGPRVGPEGRAIGVDMTPEMIASSRQGIEWYRNRSGLDNVEFRLGEIEHLPVADASVDVVISNCVINLSPDKPQVWKEIARVLRPFGRVVVSDMVLKQRLPERLASQAAAWTGCIAGASLIDEVRAMAEAAGLVDVSVASRDEFIQSLESDGDAQCCEASAALDGASLSDYITSAVITAFKPNE